MCMAMGGGAAPTSTGPVYAPPPDPKTAAGQLAIFSDEKARSDYRSQGEATVATRFPQPVKAAATPLAIPTADYTTSGGGLQIQR
jgi:hypothetical protein